MYEKLYGLTDEPFKITLDPKFLYLSKKHEAGLKYLQYGIDRKKGVVLLTGEIGTGKTTLIHSLIQGLNRKIHLAFLVYSYTSAFSMLQNVCYEFGLDVHEKNKDELAIALKKFLVECAQVQEDCILIIDEAQNSSDEVFEQLRLISNFETPSEKLIQIILVGHPELRDKLNPPKLAKFKQRIAVMYELLPLDAVETEGYITQRLAIAGSLKPLFTAEAVAEVYRYTRGIPRLINVLCDFALFFGFSDQQREIGRTCVLQAARQLGLSEPDECRDRNAGTERDDSTADTSASKRGVQEGTPDLPHLSASPSPSDVSDLSALPTLPSDTSRVEQAGKQTRSQGLRRFVYLVLAAGVLFGLVFTGGLVRSGAQGPSVLATLSHAIRSFFSAEQSPTQTAALLLGDPRSARPVSSSPPLSTRAAPPMRTVTTTPAPDDGTDETRASDDHMLNPHRQSMAEANTPSLANAPQGSTPRPAEEGVSIDHATGALPPLPTPSFLQDAGDSPDTVQKRAWHGTAEGLSASLAMEVLESSPPQAHRHVRHVLVGHAVFVQAGDTLGDIIRHEYGRFDPRILALIQAVNPDITDPSLIMVNQRIVLPALPK